MSGERLTSPVVHGSNDGRSLRTWGILAGATVVAALLLFAGAAAHLGSTKAANSAARLGADRGILPAPPPLILTGPTANRTIVDVSMKFNLTVNVTGGSNVGANYNYTWSGLPTGCKNNWSWSDNCTAGGAGVFQVTVKVVDTVAAVQATSSALTITVNPLPTLTGFVVTKSKIPVNGTITFTATPSGGTSPFTFNYRGLPLGCISNLSSFACTPNRAGIYNVTVSVVDSYGYASALMNVTVTVTAPVPPTNAGIGTTGWALVIGILVIGGLVTVALLFQARREERAGRMGLEESTEAPARDSGGPPPSGGMPPGPQS